MVLCKYNSGLNITINKQQQQQAKKIGQKERAINSKMNELIEAALNAKRMFEAQKKLNEEKETMKINNINNEEAAIKNEFEEMQYFEKKEITRKQLICVLKHLYKFTPKQFINKEKNKQ